MLDCYSYSSTVKQTCSFEQHILALYSLALLFSTVHFSTAFLTLRKPAFPIITEQIIATM